MKKNALMLSFLCLVICLNLFSCQSRPVKGERIRVCYTLVFPTGQNVNNEQLKLWQSQLLRRAEELGIKLSVKAEEGCMLVTLTEDCSDDIFRPGNFLVVTQDGEILLTGEDVEEVSPYQDETEQDAVFFRLKKQAKEKFAAETLLRQGEVINIFLDDELVNTTVINKQIKSGEFLLVGERPVADARLFAALIKHPLPLYAEVFSQEVISEPK